MMNVTDQQILGLLQSDCTLTVSEIGKATGLSPTQCWRKITKFEEDGVIRGRVALLDPAKIGAAVSVFLSIRAGGHSEEWSAKFKKLVSERADIVDCYRTSGEFDYMLRVVVADIAAYDAFYQDLISHIELDAAVSAFAMEQVKHTTALPLRLDGKRQQRA